MLKKVIWLMLYSSIVVSLVLASCAQAVEEEEEEGGPTTGENWWDEYGEPEYGGTITVQVDSLTAQFDPYNTWGGQYSYYGDWLWEKDWTLSRDTWPFTFSFTPPEYWMDNLVESWEMEDPQTLVAHLRKGVHWHNKPPTNGREFTAYDVQEHYDRNLGTGSGYTEPNPFQVGRLANLEQVIATDKYTFTAKFKEPSLYFGLLVLVEQAGGNWIEAPEAVDQDLLNDWEYAVGTGPWILTDFISGSSATYVRNPDYWGYDERHPENKLPYADTLKTLNIPDFATKAAALRSGQIDVLTRVGWEQAASIAKTNPELLQMTLPDRDVEPQWRIDRKPFDDIRVRKALQLAIDREEMAESLYGGTVDGKPTGLINPALKGWTVPYDEWPEELQEEYSYNPTKAKELLAEAGYPDGFSTHLICSQTSDIDRIQVIKAQLEEINVDMEIEVFEQATYIQKIQTMSFDQMCFDHIGVTFPVLITMHLRVGGDRGNYTQNYDPAYDAIYANFASASSGDEAREYAIEAEMYLLSQHWQMHVFPTVSYNIWQPYFKGYGGEWLSGAGTAPALILSRTWIDSELKKEMGR